MKTKNIDYRKRILLELAETNQYLFSWDDIRGDDNERLIEVRRGTGKRYINPKLPRFYFLMRKFAGIYWMKTAKIEKIDDGNTIRIYNEKNFLSLTLNEKKTKVNLKIDDRRTVEFVPRMENGKLNVFTKDSYSIRELETLTGLDFQTIDNILNEKEISNLIDIVKENRIRSKSYKLKDDFDKFIELICYIDESFDSLMCTNYYRKFEPEFRNRINEQSKYITGQYISINFYDSNKDIYDNIKESYFFGLKEIAKKIQRQEKLKERLKLLKSGPLDERTNLQIMIMEAELKSNEDLKLFNPIALSEENSVSNSFNYDVFICHASEDKESFVSVLALKLCNKGFKVWYDDFTLSLGDNLRRKISHGLAHSRYGVVVLSKKFFEKEWPQKELDGLVARENGSNKVILPIWHNITQNQVTHFSPMLADRVAVSSDKGIDYVVDEIARVINGNYNPS
jgi:hypothetical protein